MVVLDRRSAFLVGTGYIALKTAHWKHADFIVAALRIVLIRNYCLFDDKVYRQFIGFATGISCGGEVANMFIYVLTRHVFKRYKPYILSMTDLSYGQALRY
jgi:hypothetical protein